VSAYRNVTFDELEVGTTASAQRALTQTEIEALVLVSGDIEPFQLEDAGETPGELLAVDAVGIGAVISGMLERRLPGPGTRIVSMNLEFAGQVRVGEELAATVTVRDKRPDSGLVLFDCDARVGDRRVLWGTAVVEAPRRRLAYSDIATPEIVLRRNDVFARLLKECEPLEPVACAVAHPCDRDSLLGALEAARRRLIVPVLVGPPARIRQVAEANGADITGLRIVATEHSHASAAAAAALARAGEVEMLMKGSLHTDEILGQIEGGILDGPPAFDNAISEHAARTKSIRSPVAGRADILMVPNIESGNMLAKQLQYFAGADSAGVVLGARVPVVLTSRADNVRMRIGSAAVAKLLAHARRTGAPRVVA
jgi:phosphate acetyltransferase